MLKIYIDADACPVKNEVFKVAKRYNLITYVVANQYLNVPLDINIRMEAVTGSFDAADDWIVEKAVANDIVITSDILLAERCVKKSVKVIGPKGNEFNEENIGSAISGRKVAEHMRFTGHQGTGPSAMTKADKSNFLSTLDRIIQKIKRDNHEN